MAATLVLLLLWALSAGCLGNSLNGKIAELEGRLNAYEENWNETSEELKSLKETISAFMRGVTGSSEEDESSASEVNININVPNCDCKCANGSCGLPGPPGPVGPPGPTGISIRNGNAGEITGINGTSRAPGGTVYTRWGRTGCNNDSTLVYSGYTGNSKHDHEGGGVNYQCMPDTPEYNSAFTRSVSTGAFMAGVEYESSSYGVFPNYANNQDAPCAVCYTSNRPALMMIPAKRTCPHEWTKEYEGYLMSEQSNHKHQTTFECVDTSPEYLAGGSDNKGGGLFYFTRSDCSKGSYCPPYRSSTAITCVVCTK